VAENSVHESQTLYTLFRKSKSKGKRGFV